MIKKISIIQEDIDRNSHVGNTCPVGLAIRRACPTLPRAHAGLFTLFLKGQDEEDEQIAFPHNVSDWISMYDRNHLSVKPFEFEMELPCD